ncbi:MAG: DciA family protein [Acidimicrobiales bacterium]
MPWEPLPDNSSEPRRLYDSLDRLLDRLSGTSMSATELVMTRWADVVGEDAAAATTPVKIHDGVLTVRVEDPVWATQLSWLEPQIVARVSDLLAAGSAMGDSTGDGIRAIRAVSRPG